MVPQVTKVPRPQSSNTNQPNSARGQKGGVLNVRKGPNAGGNQGKTLRINKN